MKYNKLHLPLAILILFALLSCKNETQMEEDNDRNMGGIGITRGLTITSADLAPGYILFNVPNSAITYLMDREANIVHSWQGNFRSMLSYLTDDGSVIRNAIDPDFPVFYGGGNAGRIQEISWEGDMTWDFEFATEKYHSHHDLAVLPNGNILAIAWENKSKEEVLKVGRDEKFTPGDGLWPDMIVEIQPNRPRGGTIVWEWHMWDHLIQDRDPTIANYGNPSEHPERIDINASADIPKPMDPDTLKLRRRANKVNRNATTGSRGCDVYHVNAINYNAYLDQIVFSSPKLGEILVIDHSTTTQEAASNSGGKMGKGGDILYRWGNPQNYGRGDSTDQKLFGQHDVRWNENDKPGAGNLTIFNNDIPNGPDSMDYSAIYEITPPVDDQGNYIISKEEPYGPEEPSWTYIAHDTVSFFSSYISGAHRMENGNTFINEGAKGRFFEVNPEGEILWEYLNPYRGKMTQLNGDLRAPGGNPYSQFRSIFIPADHPAFADKELIPMDPQPAVYVYKKEKD